jgi:integrase/recombinase XerD
MSALAQRSVGFDPLRESRFPEARAARDQADWLGWLEIGGTRPRTLDDYSWATDRLLEAFPSKAIGEFTDGDLLFVLKRFPPRSRRVRLAAFRSFFKWAVRTRRIDLNPVELLPEIKSVPPHVIEIFTPEEVQKLTTLGIPDGQLMTVLFEAGLRRSEARHIQLRDFDVKRREVKVTRGTKGGKERVVVMSHKLAFAVEELRELEGLNAKDHLWFSRPGGGSVIKRDQPVSATSFRQWWVVAVGKASVRYLKPHTARHTYATFWREKGLPLDDLQMMLGHSSISTTSNLYVHTQVKDIRRRMDELDEG